MDNLVLVITVDTSGCRRYDLDSQPLADFIDFPLISTILVVSGLIAVARLLQGISPKHCTHPHGSRAWRYVSSAQVHARGGNGEIHAPKPLVTLP
jgi:hypothetical protein